MADRGNPLSVRAVRQPANRAGGVANSVDEFPCAGVPNPHLARLGTPLIAASRGQMPAARTVRHAPDLTCVSAQGKKVGVAELIDVVPFPMAPVSRDTGQERLGLIQAVPGPFSMSQYDFIAGEGCLELVRPRRLLGPRLLGDLVGLALRGCCRAGREQSPRRAYDAAKERKDDQCRG